MEFSSRGVNMADRVGQQLGHYRLVRLLGRGGFAEVYLGEHLRLKTQVAVKILHTSLEDDDVEGFLREAQTVAHLKHPYSENFLSVYSLIISSAFLSSASLTR